MSQYSDLKIHPTAEVSPDAEIGPGTSIWHQVQVRENARIGFNCILSKGVYVDAGVVIGNNVKIQNYVSIYHGVTIEDGVFCGPSMVFTNVYNPRSAIKRMHELRPTLVKKGVTIGANASIVCGITISSYAFIGAGAVVLKDVPDYALMVGNPATRKGWMCACGEKLKITGEKAACGKCGKKYRRTQNKLKEVKS